MGIIKNKAFWIGVVVGVFGVPYAMKVVRPTRPAA
jgi:hypothetical protein